MHRREREKARKINFQLVTFASIGVEYLQRARCIIMDDIIRRERATIVKYDLDQYLNTLLLFVS